MFHSTPPLNQALRMALLTKAYEYGARGPDGYDTAVAAADTVAAGVWDELDRDDPFADPDGDRRRPAAAGRGGRGPGFGFRPPPECLRLRLGMPGSWPAGWWNRFL